MLTPSPDEKIRVCIEHLKLNVQYKSEKYGVQTFRKHYVGYLKGLPNIAPVRSELMQYTLLEQAIERLQKYLNENFDSRKTKTALDKNIVRV